MSGVGIGSAPGEVGTVADWEAAQRLRRSTTLGYVLLGLGAASVGAIALSVAVDSVGAIVLMHVAAWISLRSFANALDVGCDVAWDWSDGGDHQRKPKRSDRWALGLVIQLEELADRLTHPVVHETIAVGSGIEVVELEEVLDDPYRS